MVQGGSRKGKSAYDLIFVLDTTVEDRHKRGSPVGRPSSTSRMYVTGLPRITVEEV